MHTPPSIRILEAEQFATRAHRGQRRKYTDEPYSNHPLRVATIVAGLGLPDDLVVAALLHDTIEDTKVTSSVIARKFGDEVADLVVDLTDDYKAGPGTNRETRKEKYREQVAAASAEVQTVKLADLLDNARSIAEVAPDKDLSFVRQYLQESWRMAISLRSGNASLRQSVLSEIEKGLAVVQARKGGRHGITV